MGFDGLTAQTLWTNCFVEAQGWNVKAKAFQDNVNAMSLEHNGKSIGGKQTKHIDVGSHFVKDCIDRGELTIEHLGTDDMWADHFT